MVKLTLIKKFIEQLMVEKSIQSYIIWQPLNFIVYNVASHELSKTVCTKSCARNAVTLTVFLSFKISPSLLSSNSLRCCKI